MTTGPPLLENRSEYHKLVITVEIGLRGVGESRVYGSLLILSKSLECHVFPFGYWTVLCGVTFPAVLLCQVLPTYFL